MGVEVSFGIFQNLQKWFEMESKAIDSMQTTNPNLAK